jgi:hypothetical protein
MLSVGRVCKCFVHDCKRIIDLSASGYNRQWKALCCKHKEEGSSELRRSFVLCREGFRGYFHVTY